MEKRKLQRNLDNEAKLARHGKAIRSAINAVNDALKTAHQPAETLRGIESQGGWQSFIRPGDVTGTIYEFASFPEFVKHEDGLNLHPDVFKWLMSCPVDKIDHKAVGKKLPMNTYS